MKILCTLQDTAVIFILKLLKSLQNMLKKTGIHPVSLAVAWAASNSAVTAPIIGAGSTAQLEPSLDSVNVVITDEIKGEIDKISPSPPPATDRSEKTG